MTLPRCWPPRQHERGPCEQLRRLCKGLVCSDPKAADPIGPSLKQNMAAAAVAGRADAAALRVAHAVAAVRVVVARVSPPSWCLISSVLHALHAVSRTSQVGPGCAAATAGAGRAGAAAVLVLQRVCVAHAAVAARVVVPTPASSPTPASIVAAVMVVDQTSVSLRCGHRPSRRPWTRWKVRRAQ